MTRPDLLGVSFAPPTTMTSGVSFFSDLCPDDLTASLAAWRFSGSLLGLFSAHGYFNFLRPDSSNPTLGH
jgi:hypothetical protein